MLLLLPDELGRKLLHGWLALPSVAKLDSAFCNLNGRSTFHELAFKNATIYREFRFVEPLDRSYAFIVWLIHREVCISSFSMWHRFLTGEGAERCEDYLVKFGQSIKTINLLYLMYARQAELPLKLVALYCPRMRNLEIRSCVIEDPEVLSAVLDRCHQLQSLSIQYGKMTSTVYHRLSLSCPSLCRLVFVRSAIDKVTFAALLDRCRALQHLKLACCDFLDDSSLHQVSVYCKQLRSFRIAGLRARDTGLMAVFSSCPQLTAVNLDLGDSRSVTDASILTAAAHCPFLEKVSLHNCPSITDAVAVALARGCKKLTIFRVSGSNIGDQALVAVASNCALLTVLCVSLHQNANITDASVLAAAAHCQLLREVDFSNSPNITDTAMATLAQKCPHLQHLCLNDCSGITDGALIAVAAHCRDLQTLEIDGCTQVTDTGLLALYHGCKRLVSVMLDVEACAGVTQATVSLYGAKLSDRPGLVADTDSDSGADSDEE